MRAKERFDPEKAIEVLLYIARHCPNMYTALKILYFADKEHLARYGRLISGDTYIAMTYGPVASDSYDLIKCARGDGLSRWKVPAAEAFQVVGRIIKPIRDPDLDWLSESERVCLDAAISKYGKMSFGQIKVLSHDDAYLATPRDKPMPLEAIVKTIPNSELLWEHLCDG